MLTFTTWSRVFVSKSSMLSTVGIVPALRTRMSSLAELRRRLLDDVDAHLLLLDVTRQEHTLRGPRRG